MMLPQEIIRRKRDGAELDEATIAAFVAGFGDGSISDAQIAAFAMAIFLRGMTLRETAALTRAMMRSGRVLDWSHENLPGPTLDKHSTGGVGDKTSFAVAAIVAACGGFVPMVAGRGLGHTGGTVDKLESVPGYRTRLDVAEFRRIVREAGVAIIGQTEDLAPADRRLYAIRDVTGSVESIELITSSILAKKLASGLDALVMDVKFGSGAFMATRVGGDALAESIVAVAREAGLPTTALLTDMNEVLGETAGSALEMHEAIAYFTGARRHQRLDVLTRALAAEMLLLGGLAADEATATRRVAEALDSGAAAERFARLVALHGGPRDLLERPHAHLPAAPVIAAASPPRAGHVAAIDVRRIGVAVLELGGGRRQPGDAIDHAVGFASIAGVGAAVGPDRPLALVHARSTAAAERAAASLRAAFTLAEAPPDPQPAIVRRIAARQGHA
jgi:thymidine phosphorylase